ncbi:MAG: sigma-54 dependent transcriptional regulator [Synergistaceae bacterium]|jgi:DNA-binding NtrC family response regulator|uniref:sigma-54-dependent transcriptional regulator n=1 Tax=Mesotoga sp. TaxID=2053577 RepID=UPI002A27B68B|nr:sigma-54 dependent transcriptional regulator [Synergistaceae bacterium]MDD4431169.1 sigma-54 dependent transcriptional regulator [Bacteroidales bacterium]
MNIWIVDDEVNLANGLKRAFEKGGYSAKAVKTISELQQLLGVEIPSLIFLDQRLPDGNGIDILPAILKQYPRCKVILMTAFGDSRLVVRAIQEGAYNYLDKPFPLDAAKNMVERAIESIRFRNQAEFLLSEGPNRLLGSSNAMEKIRDNIMKIAQHQNITVLLRGESGTGKEVAARMIHHASGCKGDFVALNCSAIPESLLESELFGYNKGAYTGAETDKQGLIEIADKGTLFLDEIGDMPLSLQSKLFRFLDQRSFRPLGSTKEKNVSLNLICATCLDIEKQVGEEKFRKDLFFRISVIPITIPPLRQRDKDVLELASFYLAEFSKRLGKSATSFTEDVKDVFMTYWWPGNVRELRNLIERILILKDNSDNMVRLADLPAEMFEIQQQTIVGHTAGHLEGESLSHTMDRIEREMIVSALARCMGSRTQTAAELGISRFSLLRRMQRHGLE